MFKFRVLVLLVACMPVFAQAYEVVDATGFKQEFSKAPSRIVTLQPSLAEWVVALGAQARLVGVAEKTDYPAELKSLPSIGPYHRVNLETIVSLKPDLVIASTDGNARDQVEHLRELKVPVIVVKGSVLSEIYASIHFIGEALNLGTVAREVEKKFQTEVQSFKASAQTKTVLFQIGDEPLFVVGAPSFVNDEIEAVGGINIYKDTGKAYPQVSIEDARKRDPDCILISSSMGNLIASDNAVKKWLKLGRLKAVKNHCVKAVNADLLLRPSPRLPQALRDLQAALFNP